MKYLRAVAAARLVGSAAVAWAQPPVPLYATNVSQVETQGPGTIVIVTKDSADAVGA